MNYDIFIPVRLKSSRLPKKAMMEILGRPIISNLVSRLRKSTKVRKIVVCTTTDTSDDELVEFLKNEKIDYFRGNESDIIKRLMDSSEKYETDFAVIVDGDDIYTEYLFVDEIINEFEKSNSDYIYGENFPHGLVPVGIKRSTLKKINAIKLTDNTETGYREFFEKNDSLKRVSIKPKSNFKFPKELRLTLDYAEDYEIAKEIFSKLGLNFNIQNIIQYISENPSIINKMQQIDILWQKHWEKNIADLSIKKTDEG